MSAASTIFGLLIATGVMALGYIVWDYMKGLRGSPRELWLITGYNLVEYSAYGAMNLIMVIWLSADCGLSDLAAGAYLTVWSSMLSVMSIIAGPLVDTVGIRRVCLLSVAFLFVSRAFMSVATNPLLVFATGFVPLAVGFAIVGPVVSVGIKRYTTLRGSALGFGLFYVLMNIGYTIGGWAFDWIRGVFATRDAAGKVVDANSGAVWFGWHFSTNQLFFVFGTLATALSVVLLLPLRDGVERHDDGSITVTPRPPAGGAWRALVKSACDTARLIRDVCVERFFWVYMGFIALTVFVNAVFFHFHYTFPKYGVRVLGEDARIGSIYGVLNPVLILFLVPLVAAVTKKVRSFTMLFVGGAISALSCFLACIPAQWFEPLSHTVLGEIVFVNWLGMAPDMGGLMADPPVPEYWPLIFFIAVFTFGEAIWSPRLMQFSAEIAPKGRESTYLSLSILPWFLAKLVVGPLSGVLLNRYTPVDGDGVTLPHPDHTMLWFWVGAMALITPLGLMVFARWVPRGRTPAEVDAENLAEGRGAADSE